MDGGTNKVITKDEIEELKKQFHPRMFRPNKLWKKAFEYYNNNNSQKLSLMCTPCYGKVLKWIIQQQSDNETI